MSLKVRVSVASAALASTLLACAPASALVIGAPATGGNYIPFGSASGWPEYQQVYASSDFPGTITIDDIEFYTVPGSTGTLSPGTFTISLSTTSAAVNNLDASLASNIGPNNTVVYLATLPAVQKGVLIIPLSTPFTYQPSGGNLLIDLYSQTPYSGGPAFAFNGASGGAFSRAWTAGNSSFFNNSGLVTGFIAAPEPSTWAMMAVGFAGLGLAGYRQSRKAAAIAA
jgi:hypothetical protein